MAKVWATPLAKQGTKRSHLPPTLDGSPCESRKAPLARTPLLQPRTHPPHHQTDKSLPQYILLYDFWQLLLKWKLLPYFEKMYRSLL
ncbi:hypothetical protein E1A91_A12G111900v1 [Gossypium mustelinum]|uniref:Uncharacterized protein n=1 Tax=Gossypium mustelinum TaxID=34275 RepID=A0A5D2WT58_GOSMU|nr:hypothetical protein E1A91_A12G111900v1 [Gossypium mustelinum]TYJ04720.1 hypothetical protein E1A91_A12G111900v1 [Gossypium mustelinum]